MCWINTMKLGARYVKKIIKNMLKIKFHSMPVFHEKYIKATVREFNGVIKTNFLAVEIPKENVHYIYITCITIHSVMRMERKNCSQIYSEESKYKIKKTKMTNFIKAKLESELEPKLESDIELELKSELESETE